MRIFGTLLLLYVLPAAGDNPVAKVPLGKDTTVATGPHDKEGYIDYEVALNERLGKGITPESNANVLIWQALGPKPEAGRGMPPEFFKALGIAAPPEKGNYLVDLGRYLKDNHDLAGAELNEILEQQGWAAQRRLLAGFMLALGSGSRGEWRPSLRPGTGTTSVSHPLSWLSAPLRPRAGGPGPEDS